MLQITTLWGGLFKLIFQKNIIGNAMINEGRVATHAYLASNLSHKNKVPG